MITVRRQPPGQSVVEYIVVCAALSFALFVPIPDGAGGEPARTTVQMLLDAVQLAYQHISHAISYPT